MRCHLPKTREKERSVLLDKGACRKLPPTGLERASQSRAAGLLTKLEKFGELIPAQIKSLSALFSKPWRPLTKNPLSRVFTSTTESSIKRVFVSHFWTQDKNTS